MNSLDTTMKLGILVTNCNLFCIASMFDCMGGIIWIFSYFFNNYSYSGLCISYITMLICWWYTSIKWITSSVLSVYIFTCDKSLDKTRTIYNNVTSTHVIIGFTSQLSLHLFVSDTIFYFFFISFFCILEGFDTADGPENVCA